MKKKGAVIITNTVIWGIVIIGCALALRGTGAYPEIQLILGGGAALHRVGRVGICLLLFSLAGGAK